MTSAKSLRAACLASALAALALPVAAQAKDGVSTGPDGISLELGDGAVELTLGGRLHVDGLSYEGESDFRDVDFRRARIELSGEIGNVLRFRVDREFARSGGWRNVWALVEPVDGVRIRGGNFIVPFSMEELQSSNRAPLMERSLATVWSPGFSVGGAVEVAGGNWTLAAGYFGDALANEDGRSEERGQGFAARGTFAPVRSRGKLVHFGAAIERRDFAAGETASFRSFAGSPLAPTLISTGLIADPDRLTNVGAEAAFSRGPFLLQGQYVRSRLDRTAAPTLESDSWYAQASWVLTGQRYDYSRSSGVVSGVRLRRSKGAVELAARYSGIDQDDAALNRGQARALTLGANWYLNSNVRLMANYVRSEAETAPGQPERRANLFAGRFQLSF
jgi:phosphate-selective porin OprO/OprP